MVGNQKDDQIRRPENKKLTTPEHVYVTLRPNFASLLITVPNLNVDLPENPLPQPDDRGLTVTIKNNGKFSLNPDGYQGLGINDYNIRTEIESMDVWGEHFTGEEIMAKRKELLERFFHEFTEGRAEALHMITAGSGLEEGDYLYRAITRGNLAELHKEGSIWFSHQDPSANFESQKQFEGGQSQVKMYANDSDYSGKIIRWKIEHQSLYRPAGSSVFRVVPLFTHYLPKDIEISRDKGAIFQPFVQETEAKNS